MITNSPYRSAKKEVLEVFNGFSQAIQDKLVSGILKSSNNILESLQGDIERIKQDKFHLMVAGEAKCGKSTFINAYLGVDILPMDVMQCTSSIIEIKYGEQFLLEAVYSDGQIDQISGEDNIRQFLKVNAAIDEDYRSIPVPVINSEILIKSKGKPAEHDIKNLIAGVHEANVHNLLQEEYEQKIRDYINAKKNNWQDIVVKLTVSYPFESEELRGIEIIDSPGVNAAGNIGDSTEAFIKKADAIMFLKPLTGAALESNDFRRFLEKSSNEKSKNALFLILTRAADSNNDEILELSKQAKKLYPSISEEQILPVDSKAQMFKSKIKDMQIDEIQQCIIEGLTNDKVDKFIAAPWAMSGNNKKKFIENIEYISRFEPLNISLEKFGRKAHFIRLIEVLDKMEKINTKAFHTLLHECQLYEQKIKKPDQLEIDIKNLENAFEETRFKMFDGIQEIKDLFTGSKGKVSQSAMMLKGKFESEFNTLSGTSMKEIKALSNKAITEYNNLFEEIQRELVELCNAKLLNLSNNIDIPFETLEVSITAKEFAEIETKAQEEAIETKDITTGVTFKKVETISAFNHDRYAKTVRDNIIGRFSKITTESTKVLQHFTENVLITFGKKLSEQAQDYVNRLEEIRNEAQENEVLMEKVASYKAKIGEIEELNQSIVRLRKVVNLSESE